MNACNFARIRLFTAMLLSSYTFVSLQPQAPNASSADADRKSALAVVQALFDAMAAKDVEATRRITMPEARFYAVGEKDGKPRIVRTFTTDDHLKDLAAAKSSLRERMWNPEVRVRGFIASVWTPYDFWVDGKFSHCGIDVFDLIKTEEGWRIAGGVFTVDPKCEPSPLGPLKQ